MHPEIHTSCAHSQDGLCADCDELIEQARAERERKAG